jgi:type IV pilus assembly protein PilW
MSLIELLIGMALALLVLGTVAALFAGSSSNRNALERSARLAENAHYAMEVLRNDIAQAGYYDALVTSAGGFAWQTPDPGPCATAVTALGWGYPPPSTPAKSITSAPVPIYGLRAADATPPCLPDRKPGTAILMVRFVGPETTPPASASGTLYLQLSKCDVETPNIQNLGVFSNNPAHFTLHSIGCATVADVKRYVSRAYYVATCDRCGIDSIPTLKRADLIGDQIVVAPVVEGVENFQVDYGIDANGDGTPDRYLEYPDATIAPAYGLWANVMAVRVYLLVRSTDPEPGYSETKQFNLGPAGYVASAADGYKRVLVTSLVRPMNPAGQRETP